MKTQQRIAFFVLASTVVAGGGYGLYRAGLEQGMHLASPAATAAGQSAKKPLYWHDPMFPGQKFDKPGKSPFMDMQLVPVYAEAGSADAGVQVSARVQQNLGVRLAEVTKAALASSVVAVGSVAYNERDVVVVQARAAGFIERQYVRAPLDPVRKGQPLLDLYVPDWIAVQEEFLTARRLQGGAGVAGLADAARQRMRLAGMAEEQIRQVESTGNIHARIMVTAPADGVVTELAAREGMTVLPGAPLFRISGLSTVWVLAEIPEGAAARLRPGLAVEASTPALPGAVFQGKVSAVLPQVDTTTRTLKARIELSNPGGQLMPGMFATVKFAPASGADVLQVPSEAVIRTGTRTVVMLAQAGGQFAPVDVETGAEANGTIEIRKGLQAGQKVVVSGQFLIDSEASLKGTVYRMQDDVKTGPQGQSQVQVAPVHHAEGKIEKIKEGKVTISHGPVPSLDWGPMTMDFTQPAAGMPPNASVGDTIDFDFVQGGDGQFQLTKVTPAGKTPGVRK